MNGIELYLFYLYHIFILVNVVCMSIEERVETLALHLLSLSLALFQHLFHDRIQDLQRAYPLDHTLPGTLPHAPRAL